MQVAVTEFLVKTFAILQLSLMLQFRYTNCMRWPTYSRALFQQLPCAVEILSFVPKWVCSSSTEINIYSRHVLVQKIVTLWCLASGKSSLNPYPAIMPSCCTIVLFPVSFYSPPISLSLDAGWVFTISCIRHLSAPARNDTWTLQTASFNIQPWFSVVMQPILDAEKAWAPMGDKWCRVI